MRITKQQVDILKEAVRNVVGEHAKVWLFGSRLDDSKKGGDIDIMIASDTPIDNSAYVAAKIAAKTMLELGGQKIDVIIEAPNLSKLPIHAVVHQTGIIL